MTTEYDVGDKVWIISSDVVLGEVTEIEITREGMTYIIRTPTGCPVMRVPNRVFSSKEELIKSL